MEIREDLNILADDGNLIQYEEVTVKTDNISRAEVAEIENAIAVLEQEIVERNAKIDEYKAKLNHYKAIIAKADELKAQAQEQVEGQM